MEKQRISNFKISRTIICMIFSILFIFTALNIPITAYARHTEGIDGSDSGASLGQVLNLSTYSANEIDESSNETAGYLYWAASGERSGIYYYVQDNYGKIRAHGVILDDAYSKSYANDCNTSVSFANKLGAQNILGTPSIKYDSGVSPVYYSGGWQSKGSESMAYLTEITREISIKGVRMPCPRWAELVLIQNGGDATVLNELSKPDTKWHVFVEPASVDYLYTDDTFDAITDNTVHEDAPFAAGSPKPVGSYNAKGEFVPEVYCTTASTFLRRSVNLGDTGRYRYKFYETQLPFSLCLDHDIDSYVFTGGNSSVLVPVTKCDKTVQRLSSINPHEGIAIAAIDITGFQIPPIHTYDEAKGTPGNTETPSEENGTSGECTIQKLYYTQKISTDGTILEEATDYRPYKQTSTTAYISIDTESEYEIEEWKAATSYTTLDSKPTFNSITPTHKGTSSQEILLDQDNGEKYLYILYKKTEVNPNPPQPYDFQLQQSQITKRVSFMDPDANNTTQQLFTHNFTWTAPAPTITSCTANSNKGHLKCTTSEHTHSDSCYTEDADGNKSLTCTTSEHTHTDSCYEKCSSWKWTDNTTSLGITLDTSTINKAVVSKNDSITYNQPAVNTITTSNKYYKDNTSTRSGTSQNTQSISNFNYITVLFRGQDHLTLADWKNGGAISYLTSLAYDSAYNFKSANTPQGTRKSGTEYNETFATRFINRSPDMSTTYKATVGSAGICSTTSSSYRFDTDFTLNNIVVNDPVGFIFLHIFRKSNNGRLP